MMTKNDLVSAVACNCGESKATVNKVLKAICEQITASACKGEDVTLPGVGRFTLVHKQARNCMNPFTGKPLNIPARDVPTFRVSTSLKEKVKAVRG